MIKDAVLESFRGKKCLVTGGTGLIGYPLVKMLSDFGALIDVVSLDKIKLDLPNVKFNFIDLRNFKDCVDIIAGHTFVFHLAGIKGSIDVTRSKPASFFVPLLQFNTNVLEACRINNIEKVVYTSSIGAYESAEVFKEGGIAEGIPMDMFPGWAKRMAELQVQAYKIQYSLKNFAVVRPCNVFGPLDNFDPDNAMVVPSLMSRIKRGENPLKVWGDGSSIRDFAYSKDVAEGIILALYYMPDVAYINLGSGIGISIKELLETLKRVVPFEYEWDTTKSNGFPKRVMDVSLARGAIDYNPSTDLETGLRETWEWFNKNSNEYLNRKNYFREI
jgi:GDP-L-fucose synthase